MWKLNTFLNNQWVKKEITWKTRKYLKTDRNKNRKSYGMQQKWCSEGNL